jgi:hypothetical protein
MTRLSLALNLRQRYSRTDRRTQQESRAREQIFRSCSEFDLWHIHISPLRIAALPSEATSDLKPPTYLRLQVCKKMESKIFICDRKKKIEVVII